MNAQDPHADSNRELHGLAPLFWRALVGAVVLLAVYVSAGRLLTSQIPLMQPRLLAELNQRLPFTLSVETISGGWAAFSPVLVFRDVVITQPDQDSPPLQIGYGAVRIDVPASLSAGSLQLSQLTVSGLDLDARVGPSGTIEIAGFGAGDDGALQLWLSDFLPSVERVALTGNALRLDTEDGVREATLDLHLEREGNARSLQGRVRGEGVELVLDAHGVGNPLRPLSWSGDVFLDMRSDDLRVLSPLWRAMDWPFALSGAAAVQFWLTREGGESTARLRWDGRDLLLDERSGAWSLPMDALSFQAALGQKRNHWTLLAEDFHVERAGQTLDLDRTQFDWWGRSLRMRVSELGLAALPTLLDAAPGVPGGLREALPALSPQGRLRGLELRLDDLSAPARSWSLRSVLDDVAVDSFRGAPAISGVSGYLRLQPGGGALQLDAGDFSMLFPRVYREPLRYHEAYGPISLHWDSAGLRIDSGLMYVHGDEGKGTGLFAVDVPFQPRATAVELELLIGLEDSSAAYRDKYLPYRLSPGLLSWLGRSVGDADLQRAGFIWRGSIARGQQAHRTVQLFMDVVNAKLEYDPAWPALEDLQATAWIDDARFWARGERARSAGAELRDLMVRVAPGDAGSRLDVAGSVQGDAATASVLFTDTPLAELTAGVFADWEFSGALAGALGISLPLSGDRRDPEVSLQLELDGVSAQVAQLGLALRELRGQLAYSSAQGFDGSQLSGTALGGEVRGVALPAGEDILRLELETRSRAGAIADWLASPLLHLASGEAQLTGVLRVPRNATPELTLSTDLLGVTLDAPEPFGKAADQSLPLRLAVPLRADPGIRIDLGERLKLDLQLEGDSLRRVAAAVGGGSPDATACDVRYCLGGTISSLDLAAWSDFYERYIGSPEQGVAATAPDAGAADAASGPVQDYRVDSLEVGALSLGGRVLGSSRLDVWGRDALWQGSLESGWVQGALSRRDGELELMLEYLDLARLEGGETLGPEDLRALLPSMRVDVLELRDEGEPFGAIGFDLDTAQPDGVLYASAIEGQVWGLDLAAGMPGLLAWGRDDAGEYTRLELDTGFADIGAVLSAAGYTPTLESESGSASLRLRWPGAFTDFAVASAEGSLVLAAREGRVLETRPGALALVGLLNFAEILRGLSLAHMFETGIPFETADSQLELLAGTVRVVRLSIDGATSAFEFNGISDLQERSIDGELVVTLPVANNLPWVAALAGGLPVAAGVFVVSKVFEKQVNRMSSAVYKVSGEMQSPTVEFRRLFDDKLSENPEVP